MCTRRAALYLHTSPYISCVSVCVCVSFRSAIWAPYTTGSKLRKFCFYLLKTEIDRGKKLRYLRRFEADGADPVGLTGGGRRRSFGRRC